MHLIQTQDLFLSANEMSIWYIIDDSIILSEKKITKESIKLLL